MAQQLNLHDPQRRLRAQPMSSRHGLWLGTGVALLVFAASQLLQLLAGRAAEDARALESQLVAARGAPGRAQRGQDLATELARLRALDAGQRRVQAALAAGADRESGGHAEYFAALSRQAQPALWITGLSISGDGTSLELAGRMTDASVLPAYLRRLNDEPRFKGQPFARLELKSVEPAEGSEDTVVYTEFALRSLPGQGEAIR